MRTILKTVKDRGLTIKNGGGGNIFINKEIYMEYQDLLICGFSSSSFIFVFLGGLSISIDDEDVRILYIYLFS